MRVVFTTSVTLPVRILSMAASVMPLLITRMMGQVRPLSLPSIRVSNAVGVSLRVSMVRVRVSVMLRVAACPPV